MVLVALNWVALALVVTFVVSIRFTKVFSIFESVLSSDSALIKLVPCSGHIGINVIEILVEGQGDVRCKLYIQEYGELVKLVEQVTHEVLKRPSGHVKVVLSLLKLTNIAYKPLFLLLFLLFRFLLAQSVKLHSVVIVPFLVFVSFL